MDGAAATQHGVAGIVGAAVYLLVLLLVLLVAADFFVWPLGRARRPAPWRSPRPMTAGAVLLVGYLGARWWRELVTRAASASAEQRAGNDTALDIISATTILAIGVLLPHSAMLITMAAVAAVGVAVWLGRGYVAEVVAGLQLRTQKVREVWFDGVAWQVTDIGLLTSSVMVRGVRRAQPAEPASAGGSRPRRRQRTAGPLIVALSLRGSPKRKRGSATPPRAPPRLRASGSLFSAQALRERCPLADAETADGHGQRGF